METNKELITDAQIEQAALKHVAPLFGKIGAGGDYKLTEQFRRLKAFVTELFDFAQRSEAVAVFEGWEDYGDRLRPLITVIGDLHAGDALYKHLAPSAAPSSMGGPMTPYRKFCILRDQRRAGEEAPEFTELEAFEAAIAEPLKAQQDAAAKLQRISAAVTGSINTPVDEVLNCIDLLVDEDTDKYCEAALNLLSPQGDGAPVAKSHNAVVYPPDGTASPFTVINLGSGKVKIGDSIHDDRLPALWFGKNGLGIGTEEILNRKAEDGETIAVVTFANVEGLDVLLEVVNHIRGVSFPDATRQSSADATLAAILPILSDVFDTLESESDSDIDHFESDQEERECAPLQYSARKIMTAIQAIDAAIVAQGGEGD